MKVRVDSEACTGHGRCYVLAPEIFGADEFGHCEVLVADVDGADLERARAGEANCPETAISIKSD